MAIVVSPPSAGGRRGPAENPFGADGNRRGSVIAGEAWDRQVPTFEDWLGDFFPKSRSSSRSPFGEWPHGGILRHPSYIAIRDDKDPDQVTPRDLAAAMAHAGRRVGRLAW